MEKKMKVFTDVEIVNDEIHSELLNRFGRIAYSYQACGGGGCGCGGGHQYPIGGKNKLCPENN